MVSTQTRSLEEARIKKLIEYTVTQGKGYEPRTDFKRSTDDTRSLEVSLQLMDLFGNFEYIDPIVMPTIPPITDPDQRPIYHINS